jgi:DnaJ-class molecular chaperone
MAFFGLYETVGERKSRISRERWGMVGLVVVTGTQFAGQALLVGAQLAGQAVGGIFRILGSGFVGATHLMNDLAQPTHPQIGYDPEPHELVLSPSKVTYSKRPKTAMCYGCSGEGVKKISCRGCNGSGQFVRERQICFGCNGDGKYGRGSCRRCDGSGTYREALSQQCKSCKGKGCNHSSCKRCRGSGIWTHQSR